MRCPRGEVHASVAACDQREHPVSVNGGEFLAAGDAARVLFVEFAFDLMVFACVDDVAFAVAHRFVCGEAPFKVGAQGS